MTFNTLPLKPDDRFGRQAAERTLWQTAQNHRATRTVASRAVDAQDCQSLLDMLGLSATEGKPPAAPAR